MKRLKKIWEGILQVIYPRHCPACDEIVKQSDEKICFACMDKLKLLTPPWCMRCGRKTQEGEEFCGECREKKHFYHRGRALYEYNSAAESIYRFKYGGRREYADFYGEQMAEYLGEFIRSTGAAGIVPIPLHKNRKRVRGYNQAELLAQALGKRLNIPVYPKMLVRVRDTVPQKKLNPSERENNLKKAFNMGQNDVKSKVIIVVDDIYTTGTTIDEAARVLKDNGADKVYFVTLTCGTGAS